jgi:hypothetical protein
LVEAEQEEEQEQTVKKNQPQDTSKEYDRFKELTRKLVAVPKSEIVEELEEDDLEQSED